MESAPADFDVASELQAVVAEFGNPRFTRRLVVASDSATDVKDGGRGGAIGKPAAAGEAEAVTAGSARTPAIELETLEGVSMRVDFFPSSGFVTVIEGKDKVYETFQALLSDVSPAYRAGFANTLADALVKIGAREQR